MLRYMLATAQDKAFPTRAAPHMTQHLYYTRRSAPSAALSLYQHPRHTALFLEGFLSAVTYRVPPQSHQPQIPLFLNLHERHRVVQGPGVVVSPSCSSIEHIVSSANRSPRSAPVGDQLHTLAVVCTRQVINLSKIDIDPASTQLSS